LPSQKVLEQKKQQVLDVTDKLKNACAGVIVDYKGINVENDTKLRKELREANVDYFVIKNSIMEYACDNAGMQDMKDVLKGTTAVALSNEDYVAAARILNKYATTSKGAFSIKKGFVDGEIIDEAAVTKLAKLPSREVLIAQVLGGLNAPISGFAGVLNATLTSLVRALSAVAEKKSA